MTGVALRFAVLGQVLNEYIHGRNGWHLFNEYMQVHNWNYGPLWIQLLLPAAFVLPFVPLILVALAHGPIQALLTLISDVVVSTSPTGLSQTSTVNVFGDSTSLVHSVPHDDPKIIAAIAEWLRSKHASTNGFVPERASG